MLMCVIRCFTSNSGEEGGDTEKSKFYWMSVGLNSFTSLDLCYRGYEVKLPSFL